MTEAQEQKVKELELLGWEAVTIPDIETPFGMALIVEDVDGVSHYVYPNGEVSQNE